MVGEVGRGQNGGAGLVPHLDDIDHVGVALGAGLGKLGEGLGKLVGGDKPGCSGHIDQPRGEAFEVHLDLAQAVMGADNLIGYGPVPAIGATRLDHVPRERSPHPAEFQKAGGGQHIVVRPVAAVPYRRW